MEGAENVQAQTQSMGETGGGLSSEPQSSGSGVSTGEPVAAEPTAAEPVAESQEVSSGATEAVQESFPGIDDFDWEKWDGSDYDNFPEQIKPWATKLRDRHTESLDSLTKIHDTELAYWKRMYEALNYGDEDPRIAELNTSLTEATEREKQIQAQLEALTQEIDAEREAENTRYFAWFEKNYQPKLEELAKINGAEVAEQMVLELMDLNMEVHVAVDLALMGSDAVDTAKKLAPSVNDSALLLEIINSRFPNQKKAVQPQETRQPQEPSPAAQVVAGSAPVTRPAQLAKEKSPVYGSSNQRMASLMSAAENAIRKSKRR